MNHDIELYQSGEVIHPRSVKGHFRVFKSAVLFMAYGVFFLLPWVRWERGVDLTNQAVMFDIPGHRYYLFDLVVYPQDIFLLAGLLIIAAWFLFFATGLVGRAFCGYFCFQTLWTDFFIMIEHWVQGERPARLRLEKEPWNTEKLFKKGVTWFLWMTVAFWTAFTFTAYWADAPTLFFDFFTGAAHSAAYMTIGILSITTFLAAGLMREQICLFICPYSRFQTVMYDKETLIVSYDENRGEGEKGRQKIGKGLKNQEERLIAGYGDCIDCELCVQVCPTGIDIREGIQIGCITCGLCIDACDTIMDSRGWSHGLIRYASEVELETGVKPSLLKFRTIGYAIAITVVSGILWYSLLNKAKMDFAVNQVRSPLFTMLSDGRVQNAYEIKINNKQNEAMEFDLRIEGMERIEYEIVGDVDVIHVDADDTLNLLVRLKYEAQGTHGQHDIRFVLEEKSDKVEPSSKDALFVISR